MTAVGQHRQPCLCLSAHHLPVVDHAAQHEASPSTPTGAVTPWTCSPTERAPTTTRRQHRRHERATDDILWLLYVVDMTCFEDCECTCYDWNQDSPFNRAIESETRLDITLRRLLGSHVGWYHDGQGRRANGDINSMALKNVSGVYILWQQDGYCSEHDAEHLRAYYVGRSGSSIATRLKRHQTSKQVNEVLTTEVSVWQGPSRLAKYLEQLLLDLYRFPLNGNEMRGMHALCHHISPASWN